MKHLLSSQAPSLSHLRSLLRRGEGEAPCSRRSTGHADLDRRLRGGFLVGALNEVLLPDHPTGIMEALLPLLRPDPDDTEPRFSAWVHPHWLPYPVALAQAHLPLDRLLLVRPRHEDDQLWAMEKILRSGLCATLVSRLPAATPDRVLRRLQLAAKEGRTLVLLCRPQAAARCPSPAPLRLVAAASRPTPPPHVRSVEVTVAKSRGLPPPRPFSLIWPLRDTVILNSYATPETVHNDSINLRMLAQPSMDRAPSRPERDRRGAPTSG